MANDLTTISALHQRQQELAAMSAPEDVQAVIVGAKRAEQIAKAAEMRELVLAAGETRVLAQRRLGLLLRQVIVRGRPGKNPPLDGGLSEIPPLDGGIVGEAGSLAADSSRTLLKDLGINEQASSRLQRLSDYPEEQLREFCAKQADVGAPVPGIAAVLDALSGRSKHGPDYNSADTKSNEHYTPKEIWQLAEECFGGTIDLDPCCNPGKANVRAGKHYREKDNGLSRMWFGNVFCNPPYGRDVHQWAEKARSEVNSGAVKAVIMLLAARPGTAAFKALRGCPICFFDERVAFIGANNTGKAPFPSVAYWVSTEPETRFVEAFKRLGPVYVMHPDCFELEAQEERHE